MLSTLASTPLTIPRYAWVPQFIVLLMLAGAAGPKFDVTMQSTGDDPTITGNRLSFFSVCLSAAITYAPGSADFLVYCNPELISRTKVFTSVLLGLSLSFSFCFMLGVGLASGTSNDPAWAAAGPDPELSSSLGLITSVALANSVP
jgi:purine-cytosine permease-like protein